MACIQYLNLHSPKPVSQGGVGVFKLHPLLQYVLQFGPGVLQLCLQLAPLLGMTVHLSFDSLLALG